MPEIARAGGAVSAPPKISVIIRARDEAASIGRLLAARAEQHTASSSQASP
jgi:hypothetical protein